MPIANEQPTASPAEEQARYQAILRSASPVLPQSVACDVATDATNQANDGNAVPIASCPDQEFDKHQKIGLWLAGGGLLVVSISPFFKWVNFGAGGVTGLAGDGKILLAVTVVAAIAYGWSATRGQWRVPLLLLVQSWGTLVAIWMVKLIGQATPSLDSSEVKDNPFAVLMATQVGPGAGLYLGLIGGIAVAGALGFVAVRYLYPIGRLKLFYASQSTCCLFGILLAVFVSPDTRSKRTDSSILDVPEDKAIARAEAQQPEDNKGDQIQVADPWEKATAIAENEVIRVEVESITIGRVKLKDFRGEANSEDELLQIQLCITNKSDVKKIDYRSWSASHGGFLDAGSLRDDLDNSYKRISFGLDSVVGQIRSESIYPSKSIVDLLVFEVPIERANFFKLELPVRAYGGTGENELRLKIQKTSMKAIGVKPREEEADPWAKATERVKEDQVTVAIYEAAVGKVELSAANGDKKSATEFLKIRLEITNDRGQGAIDYKGWSRSSGESQKLPVLKDSSGHKYKMVNFPIGTRVYGQKNQKSLYQIDAKSKALDILVFEVPIEGADFVMLELPKSAIGGDEDEVFRLKYACHKIKED